MQWKTILSLPIKCRSLVSSLFHHFSHSFGNSSIVFEIYPIGASNQTYKTLPSAPSTGTGTPHSKSLLTARGCRPPSSQDLHCPYTFTFHSLCCSRIQSLSQGSYWSNGRYQ